MFDVLDDRDRSHLAKRLASGSHAGEADLTGLLVQAPLVLDRIEESQLPCHGEQSAQGV